MSTAFFANRLEGRMLPAAAEAFPELPTFRNLLQPFNYRVVVFPRQIASESRGGIAIPDETIEMVEKTRTIGCILAMGEKCFTHPDIGCANSPQVGDWVLFPRHAGDIEEHKGALHGEMKVFTLRVLRDVDIYGKYPEGLLDVMGI